MSKRTKIKQSEDNKINFDLDVKPGELARWLQIPLNQRKRTHKKFIKEFGPNSAAVGEVSDEIVEIQTLIDQCMKEERATAK
jgi:hypothetical protein